LAYKQIDRGMFKMTWTPEIPGEYTIIATFAGSKSCFSSYAETALSVTEVATASPIPAAILPPTEIYIAAATAAIIVESR
jgi:hypothetical protein